MNAKLKLEKAIEKISKRSTRQRKLICEKILALFNMGQAFKIEELVVELSKTYKIGRTTIYRIIEKFYKLKILDRISLADGQKIYRLCQNEGHHHHMVCRSCRKITEFKSCPIENSVEELSNDKNFTIEEHEVTIYGLCSDCNKK